MPSKISIQWPQIRTAGRGLPGEASLLPLRLILPWHVILRRALSTPWEIKLSDQHFYFYFILFLTSFVVSFSIVGRVNTFTCIHRVAGDGIMSSMGGRRMGCFPMLFIIFFMDYTCGKAWSVLLSAR